MNVNIVNDRVHNNMVKFLNLSQNHLLVCKIISTFANEK